MVLYIHTVVHPNLHTDRHTAVWGERMARHILVCLRSRMTLVIRRIPTIYIWSFFLLFIFLRMDKLSGCTPWGLPHFNVLSPGFSLSFLSISLVQLSFVGGVSSVCLSLKISGGGCATTSGISVLWSTQ